MTVLNRARSGSHELHLALFFSYKKRKKMANDNHLSSVTCYNVTMNNIKYYNEFFELGQQKINFNFLELRLPDDDPVYTLKKVMKEMDFSSLLAQHLHVCQDVFSYLL